MFKYFKRVDISALQPDPKGRGGCVHASQNIAALLQCTSPKHPCDVVAISYMITDITAG